MTSEPTTPRPIHAIADDIQRRWRRITPAARPYLSAMLHLADPDSTYGNDRADDLVLRFLNNASAWRGDDARRIKAELRALFGWK